jgi:Spy/CpxP family protein refolding chaperone
MGLPKIDRVSAHLVLTKKRIIFPAGRSLPMKKMLAVLAIGIIFLLGRSSAYAQTGQEHVHSHFSPGTGTPGSGGAAPDTHDQQATGTQGHQHSGLHQHPSTPHKGLSLSPEQREKLRDMRRRFTGQNAQLIGAIVAKRLELQSLWTDPKTDPKIILEKAKELAFLESQLREKVMETKVEARTLLTPDQISRWTPRWLSASHSMNRFGDVLVEGGRMHRRRDGMSGEGHGMMRGHGMSGHGSLMQGEGMLGCGCGKMQGGGMMGHGHP